MFDSMGTAAGILITIDQVLAMTRCWGVRATGMGAHVAGGYYAMGAFRTAGACIDWFRSLYGSDAAYATLIAEAAAAPPGSLGVSFLPHLRLPHSPSNDPKSRGGFVGRQRRRDAGLSLPGAAGGAGLRDAPGHAAAAGAGRHGCTRSASW
jgi:xylulokinase